MAMKNIVRLLLLLLCTTVHAQVPIDISGFWEFDIDPNNIGTQHEWYNKKLSDNILLPGSMLTNDKGYDVGLNTKWIGSLYDSSYYYNPYMTKYRQEGNIKFPFFLTPKKHFVGTAWYKRNIYIPKDYSNRKIELFLERPHIETTVYINGKEVGHQMSLSTPHVFNITPYIIAGTSNTIAIKVYNGIENVCVGQDSHSVTDQTQGCWNGIIGKMEIRARPKELSIRNVQVYPNIKEASATVVVDLENHVDGIRIFPQTDYYVSVSANLIGNEKRTFTSQTVEANKNKLIFKLNFGKEMELWSEYTPNLYHLTVLAGEDVFETNFGMREITTKGRQIYVNNHPTFIRGTVENCTFPLTGYPPTDVDSWLKIFTKCKEYGLNMMRFHSYCPPEAAFDAADMVGFYLQPEGPSWPNHGVKLGQGMAIDKYLMQETQDMVEAYGNHPSFCMLAAGNEPAGNWVKWVGDFVDYWNQTDSRRIYCGASVGGGWAFDPKSDYHVKGGARGLNWDNNQPQSADDYYNNITHFTQKGRSVTEFNITKPYISHEQGQWCAFPDFKETTQYTGAYKAYNFDIFKDLLTENGMASQAEKFLNASGKLQTLAYKYEIERNLRTPEYAGFQLLGLNDYSGQGTALEGVLNVFWKEKGYCNSKQWREFCNSVVLLARFPKFIYSTDDTLSIPVEVYNAYRGELARPNVSFSIKNDSTLITNGELSVRNIPVGKNIQLGTIVIPLDIIKKPTKLTLELSMENIIYNHYDFWVYPSTHTQANANDIYITDTFNQRSIDILKKGGKVLITAAGKIKLGNDVKQTYLPVFWNTSWFKMRPPHTTGAYIDNNHPVFNEFPTDDWTNLNWWELVNHAQVMNLIEFPKAYQPIVQPIDTWHISRKLGMLIEAKVYKGKVMITTIDISKNLDQRIVARQLRTSILSYMQSKDFNPDLVLQPQIIKDLFTKEAPKVSMFTKESPDELKPKLK